MSVPDEIREKITAAEHHRSALKILAVQFSDLHGYKPTSAEAILLATVITTGADYSETLKIIMESKKGEPPWIHKTLPTDNS